MLARPGARRGEGGVREVDGPPVDEPHLGIPSEDGGRASERARHEQVVGREQHGVVPLAQCKALVVGSDVSAVAFVGQHPNALVTLGDALGDFHAAIR